MAAGDLVCIELWDADALASGGTLTSVPLSSIGMDPEHLEIKVTSAAGAADVKVEYAVPSDTVGGFGSLTAQDPLVASTATEWASEAPEEFHHLLLPSVPQFRITVTELGTNSDTLVTARAWFRLR